jgi:hypothetical protein
MESCFIFADVCSAAALQLFTSIMSKGSEQGFSFFIVYSTFELLLLLLLGKGKLGK